ncbi:MAG: DALR anticodon-binding domain-containing protein, partial [Ferruginibacter sp.]
RVDPKKTMVFNPEDSIDIQGFSAPFVQYTYARIKSILRKEADAFDALNKHAENIKNESILLPLEKEMIVQLEQYPTVLEQACAEFNPSLITNFVFDLSKTFNSFYDQHSIAKAESELKKQLRLQIAGMTANTIKSGMQLMGIRVPERM